MDNSKTLSYYQPLEGWYRNTCPSCGYCHYCGRGGHFTTPYYPTYPWQPQITWSTANTNASL